MNSTSSTQITLHGEFRENLSSRFSCSEDFQNLPGKPILVIQRTLLREIPDSLLGSCDPQKGRLVNYGMNNATNWEVEWAESVQYDADGSILPDTAKYVTRDFKTRESALTFAKKMVARDVFGSVSIAPFHAELYESGYPGTYREYGGETEYVEAE